MKKILNFPKLEPKFVMNKVSSIKKSKEVTGNSTTIPYVTCNDHLQ